MFKIILKIKKHFLFFYLLLFITLTLSLFAYLQVNQAKAQVNFKIETGTPTPECSFGYCVISFTEVGSANWGVPAGVYGVEVLVVAGGGGGASSQHSLGGGGGGGAGGLIYSSNYEVIPDDIIEIYVGNGGRPGDQNSNAMGSNGEDSNFGKMRAIGGGGGGSSGQHGLSGGSGGGGGYNYYSTVKYGGSGMSEQGNAGGNTKDLSWAGGAGGGGAGGAGGDNKSNHLGGDPGPGLSYSISGRTVLYAEGGFGGDIYYSHAERSPANSGYGGDAAYSTQTAHEGGSGIVIVKYPDFLNTNDFYNIAPGESTVINAHGDSISITNRLLRSLFIPFKTITEWVRFKSSQIFTNFLQSDPTYTSCKAILDASQSTGNGIYTIDPDGNGSIQPFEVYCDMTYNGGGWTLLFNLNTSDSAVRSWGDTNYWLGNSVQGTASSAFSSDYKSQAFLSSPLAGEVMMWVHDQGSTNYGHAIYDVASEHRSKTLYTAMNAGNITLTNARKSCADCTSIPAGGNIDTFIGRTEAIELNAQKTGSGDGVTSSYTYARLVTTGMSISGHNHRVGGLGGDHDYQCTCGRWGWAYEAQAYQSYCNIVAIGTKNAGGWTDKGYLDHDNCSAGTANIDYAFFFREGAAATTYTLTYSAGTGGYISGASPQTVSFGGSGSAVTAVANSGYNFVNWSDGSTANPRTDTNVTANRSVTANFSVTTFTLTYSAGTGGYISGTSPQTVSSGGNGTTVTAVANSGYNFVNWSDGSTANPRTDTNVTANRSVTANFSVTTYTLTYSAGSGGSISGTSPQTVSSGGNGTTVTAVANSGYNFVNWSDGSTANPRTDTNVTANRSVTANFNAPTYNLTYSAGSGGYISGASPQTVNPGGSGSAVTAMANSGYYFTNWSDGNYNASRTDTNVTSNISVTAYFAMPNYYTLTYTAGFGGSISGTSPQTVIEGSGGSPVTAVPNSGYTFVNWSDGSTMNPRTDNFVFSNRSVTANFAVSQSYTLNYSASSGGYISGTSSQTVSAGGSGTTVTALPNSGYFFVKWSDGFTANPRTDTNVTASISPIALFVSISSACDASGGTVTTSGGYKIHTFTSNGTFTLNTNNCTLDVLVVGGGGGGGGSMGGGGGAGEFNDDQWPYSAGTYVVNVGAGGSGCTGQCRGSNGGTSSFSTIPAFSVSGGGGGGNFYQVSGLSGGSGGGGGPFPSAGGTSVASYGFGKNGGSSCSNNYFPGGGGGAGFVGENGVCGVRGGNGGDGKVSYITGSPVYYAGGGGGGWYTGAGGIGGGSGGLGGGGNGGVTCTGGVPGTGGGGGGGEHSSSYGCAGGSGIVIIRYPYTDTPPPPANYSLTYTAGAGGSISGTSPQTVVSGGNGSSVTAVPNSGYNFVNWSDGSTANPRTDTNVTANISVTANFAAVTYACLNATGGTITTSGNYKIHTFTSNGTFRTYSDCNAHVLVVGGGGGGGGSMGGGGGGGAVVDIADWFFYTSYEYDVVIGAGGNGCYGVSCNGTSGGGSYINNDFLSIYKGLGAGGGGSGGSYYNIAGLAGTYSSKGSINWRGGGGGGGAYPAVGGVGRSNDRNGGASCANNWFSGGGGGAGAAGENGQCSIRGGNGGIGVLSSISGSSIYYGGGGGGGNYELLGYPAGTGGLGGGGNGGTTCTAGTNGLGGGGGGGNYDSGGGTGCAGGSGVVIVRYLMN